MNVRQKIRRRKSVAFVLGAALSLLSGSMFLGCVSESESQAVDLGVTCSGKCDGFGDSIRSLYSDARNLDLGDLVNVSVEMATDELNDALDVGGLAVELGAPQIYALPEDAEDDMTLHDLDELVTGLAYRYGERELTTRVNEIRLEHLRSTNDEVYAEGSFSIEGGASFGWDLPAGGLEDVLPRIGFDSNADVEARIIAPFREEIPANGQVMLSAMREGVTRGFILPRDLDDVRSMAPGELLGLRGDGRLAINLGVGVPLLVAEPVSSLTYSLVFSAALRAALEGQLDVQMVRLDDDELVLDVGLTEASVRSARVAIEDGWGVSGLIELEVELGDHSVDLGRLAESALEERLNRQLNLVSLHAERSHQETRLSVVRLRFALDDATGETEQALAQAMRGDVRLAQALANQGQGGVVSEFDLLRSGVSTMSHAGLDLFGMSFFTTTEEREGSAVVQTPGGAATLLFDSLHEEGGWFFSSHGYTRVGLAGLTFDPERPAEPEAQTNLFVQIVEGDDYMERDKLLDHLDALILAVGGESALEVIEEHGNELQRYVEETCPDEGDPWDDCYTDVLDHSTVTRLREDGEEALRNEVASLPEDLEELVMAAGVLRLTANATKEPAASLTGPPTSVVVDYRLDSYALSTVLDVDRGEDLRRLLTAYVGAMEIDRTETEAETSEQRAEAVDEAQATINNMVETFEQYADRHEALIAAETASIDGLGRIGSNGLELHFAVDAGNRVLYEEATATSVAESRREHVTELFDVLLEHARELEPHPEQVVAYALLGLTEPQRTDLRLVVQLDTEDNWAQPFDHYREAGYSSIDQYGRGSMVSLIGGGLFDLDALLTVDR